LKRSILLPFQPPGFVAQALLQTPAEPAQSRLSSATRLCVSHIRQPWRTIQNTIETLDGEWAWILRSARLVTLSTYSAEEMPET
jgi:hypothetical protein